ncbi:MAG: glycoside hydrolase family 172 protein [Mangrovibacterium sp.]
MNRQKIIIFTLAVILVKSSTAQFNYDKNSLWSQPDGVRCRVSSYDHTGGNSDNVTVNPRERFVLFQSENAGIIKRIWVTMATEDSLYLQNVKIGMSFDGEKTVENIPIGIFFGTGPWRVNDLNTPVLNIMRSRKMNSDQKGAGSGSFNMNWPMPFSKEAEISITNKSDRALILYYYIDYLVTKKIKAPLLFHADYNVAMLTKPGKNRITEDTGSNYIFLDRKGYKGKYVGTVLCVESHPDRIGKWYEGDDMFVIDEEPWPPRLHGTGTEDYFGMAWGIHRPFQAFDHGVTYYERGITDHDRFYDGRFVIYRFHLDDPISFYNSIHASIEAGHANECEQHYESLSFWYGKLNK